MQNTLLAIGIALIAAILAALAGPWLVDWTRHKPLIEAEASRLVGLPVKIGGDLSIRLLPAITVDARDVTIGNAETGAKIGRLRGELRVAPLLRGEVALTGVHLRDVDLTVREGSLPRQGLAAEEITVENARLAVADASGRQTLIAERISLQGESRGTRGPIRFEGRAVTAERAVPVQLLASFPEHGGLSLRLRAQDPLSSLSIEAEGETGGPGNPRFDGTVVLSGRAGALPWRVAGPAAATADALVFERAEAMLGTGERAARAAGSLRYLWAGRPALEAVFTARQVDLDRLTEAGGAPRTPRDVLAALLAAAPGLAAPDLPVTLGLDIGGLTIGGALVADVRADLAGTAAGWTAGRLDARLPGDSMLELKGRVTLQPALGFGGTLGLQAERPGLLMSWLDGQPTPAGMLDDPIRLSAAVTAAPGRLVLDELQAATAAGDARGRIALDMPPSGRHGLVLDLTAEALDLDLLARLARGAGARLDPGTDIQLKLKAGEATLAGLAARGLDLTLRSDARGIRAERLAVADLAGLGIEAAGHLDGLAGPLTGEVAGRVTAARVDGLVALLGRDAERAPLGRFIAERAAWLGGADLGFRFRAGAGNSLGLAAEGRVGGTWLHLDAAGTGSLGEPAGIAGRTSLVMEAPRADALLGLVGGLVPLAAATVPARFELVLGRPANGPVTIEGEAEAADALVGFAGIRGTDGRTALAVTLTAPDLAPVLPLAGIPSELAGTVAARLATRVEASEAGWRLDGLEGRIGPTDVKAALAGRGRTVIGSVELGTLGAEALMSLATGPAWLIETEAGRAADAGFSRTLIDGVDGEVSLRVETLGLGGYPPLSGLAATLSRQGGRTALRDVTAKLGGSSVAGQVTLDRTAHATALQATFGLDRVPLALILPGAAGAGPLAIALTGEGASPAALLASLRGEGRYVWPRASVAGIHPGALRRATRAAEIAQDLGRPLDDAGFAALMSRELARPVELPALDVPLTLAGARLRSGEAAFTVANGRVNWSGGVDLGAGTLDAEVRIASEPPPGTDAVPPVALHVEGPLAAAAVRLDAEDVAGWLGLRLVAREALRLEMRESDRIERQRQRAFTRLPAREAEPAAVPEAASQDPPAPPGPVPGDSGQNAPRPDAVGDLAPLPLRRPAAPPADFSTVIRRALDGQAAAEPMSGLPPLPPPVEIGPAPGLRR